MDILTFFLLFTAAVLLAIFIGYVAVVFLLMRFSFAQKNKGWVYSLSAIPFIVILSIFIKEIIEFR